MAATPARSRRRPALRYEGRVAHAWHAGLPGGDAHAGRFETSVMLALAPGAVRLEAAEPGDARPIDQIMPVLRDRGVRAVSGNGILGNPAGASAAEGEQLLAELTQGLGGAIAGLLDRQAGELQGGGVADRVAGVLVAPRCRAGPFGIKPEPGPVPGESSVRAGAGKER